MQAKVLLPENSGLREGVEWPRKLSWMNYPREMSSYGKQQRLRADTRWESVNAELRPLKKTRIT
jgi:hypothetical protein